MNALSKKKQKQPNAAEKPRENFKFHWNLAKLLTIKKLN